MLSPRAAEVFLRGSPRFHASHELSTEKMSSSTLPTVSIDVLRTLHRIHKQLTDLKGRRDRGPKAILACEANVKAREAELNKVREDLKTMRKNIDAKQLQLKTTEQKIKDLNTKLNTAASNREYQIFKDQIAADTMANSVLEDEIIEMMDKTEAFVPKIGEAEKILKATRDKAASVKDEVQAQADTVKGEIVRLEGELKVCEQELPAPVRDMYLRQAMKKGEDAMAEIVDGACGGCYQQIPINIQSNIRMLQPNFCKTCGRLLYFPEE